MLTINNKSYKPQWGADRREPISHARKEVGHLVYVHPQTPTEPINHLQHGNCLIKEIEK